MKRLNHVELANGSAASYCMRLIKRLFPSGKLARNASILAGGTALGQAILMLVAPFLTRIYPASDLGYYQVYVSVITVTVIISTLRYEQAILLPASDEIAANLLIVALCCVAFMGTVLGAFVALITRKHLALPSSLEGLRDYLWLIPLATCGAGVYQTFSSWTLRQKGYSRIARTKLTQVLAQGSTQIVVGVFQHGPLGLLAGDAIGRGAGSLSLGQFSLRRSFAVFKSTTLSTIWRAAVRYRRFPLVSSGSSIIAIAGYSLPPILLAQLYGAKILGWFALADRVVDIPTLLVGQAVAQVYSVEAAKLNAVDPEALYSLFIKLIRTLAAWAVVPLILMLVAGPSAFKIIFGREWGEAGIYARFFAMMQFVAFFAWPLMPTLNILEQQFWQLAWDIGRLSLTVLSLLLAHSFGFSARVAVAAFCLAALLGYGLNVILCGWAIKRRVRLWKQSPQSACAQTSACAGVQTP